MNNNSNAKPNDPHGFKEILKIKYDTVLAVVRKFPNGTGPMLELLKAEYPHWIWMIIVHLRPQNNLSGKKRVTPLLRLCFI